MSAQATRVQKFLAVGEVSVKLETFQVKGSMPMSLNLMQDAFHRSLQN